jgi:small conductance mechanosensitive channel
MEAQATQLIRNTDQLFLQFSELIIRYSVSTIGAIILLCLGWILAGVLQRWTFQSLSRIHGFDKTLIGFFSVLVRYAILIVVLVMALGQFGVQTASILAALGAAGLAIGLALQGTLQNIAAGLMLLVLRPFRDGEYISVGNIVGTVQDIGLFATELRSHDGLYILAPNSSLWNTPVTNFSRMPSRMHDFKIGISYEDDIDKAFAVIKRVLDADNRILRNPEPVYFVSQLGESAVILSSNYWIPNSEFRDVSWNTIKAVKIAFDAEGINIPYPQISYHLAESDKQRSSPLAPS